MEKVQNNIGNRQKYPKYGQQYLDFKIGNEVLLDTRNMDRGKLDEWRAGPLKISWVGWRACILEGISEGYHPTFHVFLLEKYNTGSNAITQVELPPLQKGQGYYELEKIIAHGTNKDTNKTRFLVLWKGYR